MTWKSGRYPFFKAFTTSSIPVVNELIHSDIEILIIGGKVRQNEQSIVAFDYLFNFSELNISKTFICASGITVEKGISDYNLEEANTRKKIIDLSQEVYVAAADSTKFGKDVTIGISPLDKIDYIITDDHVHKDFISSFKKTDTLLILS
ncbi:hypothetical protein J7E95_10835 [Streptomyces sp. ISL-14]|uniref:hypothetical protein n=1 Tax=Bacillus sp. ISL-4 TaxID=2819125 RepID=UPI001C1835FD|nr:hypothetical protein [Bacillus sp. ISL-4]MBT2671310.1 hypothetical protein [Streptomyces sp. ISL-14]